MLQKHVELEGLEETEVKAEEEPKDETIGGSGSKALRPLGMDIIFFWNIFPLFWVYLYSSPLGSLFTSEPLWLLDEPEEDEHETEESEISTREQNEFDWACTWMEEGGSPDLAEWCPESTCPGICLYQTPFSFILFSDIFFCPSPWWHFRLPNLSYFFPSRGAQAASGQFPMVGGRPILTQSRLPGGWRSPASGICCGQVRGRGLIQPPLRGHDPARFFYVCVSAPAQKSLAWQPKSPKLQLQNPWFPSVRGCIWAWGPPYQFPIPRRQQYHRNGTFVH